MSFSFNTALVSTRDKIRLRIGDTLEQRYYLDDGTIDALLTIYTTELPTAIACVKAILAKIAKDNDRNGMSITDARSQVFEHYSTLLQQLERDGAAIASPFFGGLSLAANLALESDTDARQPANRMGQDDYP